MRSFLLTLLAWALVASVYAQEPGDFRSKNVLLLIADDLKADALSVYGDSFCKTPNIDRLAARGVVFDRAYCQGTWCLPSRVSFMRSRYHDKGNVTMGEHFIANGIHSARVGKIFHMRVPGDIIDGTNGEDVEACWSERFNTQGLEAHTPGAYACLNLDIFTRELEGRESTKMPNRMFVTVETDTDGTDQPDYQAASKSVELLRELKDEPFFLATGFVRPHYPNVAPPKYFAEYDHEKIPLPEVPENDLSDIPPLGMTNSRSEKNGFDKYPENQKRMWAGYYATITYMDEQLGRVLDELDRLGLTESTTIVFTSDHGYMLGEHTFWQKSNLHEESTRVPLIVAGPGVEAGRSDSLVELVDLYPTFCDTLGLDTPEEVEGLSLLPILRDNRTEIRKSALSLNRTGNSLRSAEWAYMRYHDGSEELYDMLGDPDQFTNLANDSAHSSVLEQYRADLAAHVGVPPAPAPKMKKGKK